MRDSVMTIHTIHRLQTYTEYYTLTNIKSGGTHYRISVKPDDMIGQFSMLAYEKIDTCTCFESTQLDTIKSKKMKDK